MARLDLDSVLQGVIVADPLITADTLQPIGGGAGDSSYDRADLVPGVAVYQRGQIGRSSTTAGDLGPRLTLQVLGQQSEDVEVIVTRAGMPGIGCEVAVEMDDGSDGAHWRGRSTAQVHQQLSAALLDRGIDGPHNFAGVDLGNGQAVIVWNDQAVIYGRRYDLATHDWAAAAVTIADHTRAMDTDGAQPPSASYVSGSPVDVLRLSSGRLLVAAFVLGPGGGVDLVVHYSDDDALTWRSLTLAGYDVELPAGATYSSVSWAVGTDETVLLLVYVAWTSQDVTRTGWVQYASADQGHSFTLVQNWQVDPVAYSVRRPDVAVAQDGTYCVAYVRDYTVQQAIEVRRIGSPYLPLRDVDDIEVVLETVSSWRDVTIWTDPAGPMYLSWNDGERVRVARSLDNGASWDDYETALTRLPGGTLGRCRAVPVGSRVLWMLQDRANGVRPDQDLALVESGGWTMVPMPKVEAGHPSELRGFGGSASFVDAVTWLPLADPATYGWTTSGTAPTAATTGELRTDITAQGDCSRALGSHAVEDGIVVHWEMATIATPVDGTVRGVGLEVTLGNGAQDMRVDIRVANGGVTVYDLNGPGAVGSAAIDCTERRVYRLGLRYGSAGAANDVALYSRLADSDLWVLHVAGHATRRTSGAGTSSVRWGHLAAGAWSSTWYAVHATIAKDYGSAIGTTDSLAAGLVISQAPDTLPGALLPAYPGRLHVRGQTYLRGRNGPGARGDLWVVDPDSRYPARNLLTRSPQEEHRTDTDGTAHRYVWNPRGTTEHHPGGPAIGFGVVAANFRYLDLVAGSSGSLSVIATLDLADGYTGLPYDRVGDTIRPGTGAVGGYIRPEDVIGGTVDLGGTVYTIVGATSGVWRKGGPEASLQIAAAPAGSASGLMDIWRPQGAAVLLGYTTAHTHWGLQHRADTTVTGDFRCGRMLLGPAVILGQRWSKGSEAVYTSNVVVEEVPGAYAVRKLAPMQREYALAWSEGFPTRWDSDPNYQQAGGAPVAMVGDLSPVETLTAQGGDGQRDMMLLRRIVHDPDAVSAETVQCVGRELMVYGRLEGQPRIADIDGDEAHTAVQRVDGLSFVEEV